MGRAGGDACGGQAAYDDGWRSLEDGIWRTDAKTEIGDMRLDHADGDDGGGTWGENGAADMRDGRCAGSNHWTDVIVGES